MRFQRIMRNWNINAHKNCTASGQGPEAVQFFNYMPDIIMEISVLIFLGSPYAKSVVWGTGIPDRPEKTGAISITSLLYLCCVLVSSFFYSPYACPTAFPAAF